jgi:hypothetical protein
MSDDLKPGVVHHFGSQPPVPPGPIASMLKSKVVEALGELNPGTGGAAIHLSSDAGVNLVFAHRGKNGRWQVDTWLGKHWEKPDCGWGAQAKILW